MSKTQKYMKLFGEDTETIDYNNISQELLNRIANSLLNKYQIIVEDKESNLREYRICEIEFYIKNELHNDEYTYYDDNQINYGKWYFHRTKTGNYKGGTYKGVDLTLGDIDSSTKFGVQIKSIYSTDSEDYIEGSCRCANKILDINLCKNVGEYMKNRSEPISARSTKNFHIKRCKGLDKYNVYSGPRIGLSNKYPDFKDKPYRYVIMYDQIKKEKKSLNLVETL